MNKRDWQARRGVGGAGAVDDEEDRVKGTNLTGGAVMVEMGGHGVQ